MPRLSYIFGAIIGLTALSASTYAQTDIPELILEETEGGYIIVNWEDTRTEDELPQEVQPEEIEVEEIPEEVPEEVYLEEGLEQEEGAEEAEEGAEEAQEGAEEAQEGAEEAEQVDNSNGAGNNNGSGPKKCKKTRALRQQHY